MVGISLERWRDFCVRLVHVRICPHTGVCKGPSTPRTTQRDCPGDTLETAHSRRRRNHTHICVLVYMHMFRYLNAHDVRCEPSEPFCAAAFPPVDPARKTRGSTIMILNPKSDEMLGTRRTLPLPDSPADSHRGAPRFDTKATRAPTYI